MSDQVDEDSLSVQLESSLTLEDEEETLDTASANESPTRTSLRKSGPFSILSPFKIDKDLRKEVLIRNLKTTPKKDEGSATETKLSSLDDKDRMYSDEEHEEPRACPERQDGIPGTDDKIIADVILKNEEYIETILIQKDVYIVVDEIGSVDSSVIARIDTPSPLPLLEKDEKSVKKPGGLDVDYISKDPLENADNNNPDWQLLQKLDTDEERYKAVRERWRNLIVPEPNKDLTCFAWCRKTYSEPKTLHHVKNSPITYDSSDVPEEAICKGRKRTFSACAVDSPVRRGRDVKNKEKRVRTVSCTRVYDDKIATLRRYASEECLKIDRKRLYALEDLQKQYLSEKRSLSNWSLNTGYSITRELNDLDRHHYQKRKNLTNSFEDLSSKVWERKASEITTLETASAEVLAFHKFYQGLDDKAPESMILTEEQMDEIEEINSMYDAFYKFYEE